ncbi:MAG: protoporphyrinogen/coproporphyrinogen oxidase [Mycobacterium sp.]|nr:protoporphyrinogen/coproporphyrinogen oxidase [Mycobacterium sp.]
MTTYVVVGGGISGLTAAYRLRAAVGDDARITLFDPAETLGGTLRTVQIAGHPMDLGAEAFVARRPEVPALLAELGLAGAQRGTTGARPLIYAHGVLRPMPEGTVYGIPTSASSLSGLVDESTVARVAAEPSQPLRWQPGEDRAVADLVGDRFGDQVVARSVDPLLAGVYAGSAATIGLRSAVPGLVAALDGGAASLTAAARAALPPPSAGSVFGAIDGGYRTLVDELTHRARADRVQTAVVRLERDGDGWLLTDAAGVDHRADAVVLAVPAGAVGQLVTDVAADAAAAARRIPVASSVVVALAVPKGTPLPQQSGVLVASGEPLHAKAITLSSRKWGQPENVELLRLSFGRFGDDVAVASGDDQLVCWAVEDIANVFGLTVDPIESHVARWIDAMPQYGPGHGALVARIRDSIPPTLALAGNYLDGIGVPACVASGAAAADRLVTAVMAR